MKKGISILLLLMFLTLGAPGLALGEADWDQDALKIGSTTQLSGQFFTDMWGNNSADMDVRGLIHGYQTVAWAEDGNYEVDETVVKQVEAVDGKSGRTYTFTLNTGLTYNDLTPITARDYVFSVLLLSDPRMTDLGGVPGTFAHLVGYDAYTEGIRAGEDAVFSGLRLISDTEFSLTIAKDRLPYFYELMLASVTPYPMHVIAPDCGVEDDGSGARITGPFTAELLEKTVLDPAEGYAYYPRVSAGPYSLHSYDRDTHVARFVINENYNGNYGGIKPTFEKIVFSLADQDTMFDDLSAGRLDIINKISGGERIQQGMALMSGGEASGVNYIRTGLSFLSFACERGATESANVRKAIAMCVDQDALVNDFLKGFGLPTYAYYGYGQWMAAQSQEALLEYARYLLNLNAARELLEADGWVLNEQGEAYDEEIGGTRYKQTEDGVLAPLTIKWAYPEGTEAAGPLLEMFAENLPAVGAQLEAEALPFSELLKHYYRQSERTYDMFFMATNFNQLFDPYYTFSTDDAHQGVFNTTGLVDEKLMKLADDMRKTESGDREAYLKKWFKFQDQWIEDLPLVPLYSNIYFDFTRPDLQGYFPNANWSWGSAIVNAYIGEAPEETAQEEDALDFSEEGEDEGEEEELSFE